MPSPSNTAAAAPDDRSSNSNPNIIKTKHIFWECEVDFDAQILHGTATYTLEYVTPGARLLKLDTSHLKIIKVVSDPFHEALPYTLHPIDPKKAHLGQQLSITLAADELQKKIDKVTIEYTTTPKSSAAQWLPPAQTTGKKYPYLFTQAQAIHARSLLPCQDRPGVKATYNAKVTVPSWATCVMSAVLKGSCISVDGDKKEWTWEQPVPISSYLIAMAVGELAKKDISDRCAVWSEPSVVEAAAYEFAQTEGNSIILMSCYAAKVYFLSLRTLSFLNH